MLRAKLEGLVDHSPATQFDYLGLLNGILSRAAVEVPALSMASEVGLAAE
jgi:hypothetical protein